LIPCDRKHFARFRRAWNCAPLVPPVPPVVLPDPEEDPQALTQAAIVSAARTGIANRFIRRAL
jgi:hypothetical protein